MRKVYGWLTLQSILAMGLAVGTHNYPRLKEAICNRSGKFATGGSFGTSVGTQLWARMSKQNSKGPGVSALQYAGSTVAQSAGLAGLTSLTDSTTPMRIGLLVACFMIPIMLFNTAWSFQNSYNHSSAPGYIGGALTAAICGGAVAYRGSPMVGSTPREIAIATVVAGLLGTWALQGGERLMAYGSVNPSSGHTTDGANLLYTEMSKSVTELGSEGGRAALRDSIKSFFTCYKDNQTHPDQEMLLRGHH